MPDQKKSTVDRILDTIDVGMQSSDEPAESLQSPEELVQATLLHLGEIVEQCHDVLEGGQSVEGLHEQPEFSHLLSCSGALFEFVCHHGEDEEARTARAFEAMEKGGKEGEAAWSWLWDQGWRGPVFGVPIPRTPNYRRSWITDFDGEYVFELAHVYKGENRPEHPRHGMEVQDPGKVEIYARVIRPTELCEDHLDEALTWLHDPLKHAYEMACEEESDHFQASPEEFDWPEGTDRNELPPQPPHPNPTKGVQRELIGHVGVDAGQVLILDPCNLPDWDECMEKAGPAEDAWTERLHALLAKKYMGVPSFTFEGDGTFPVYAIKNEEGDTLRLFIEFT